MSPFEESLNQLIELLQEHDSVQAFQAVEKKIKSLPELKKVAHDMKGYQQDAVLFQRIEKSKAQKEAVQDYRAKMQDASDLLQYVTKTLEEKINEELGND